MTLATAIGAGAARFNDLSLRERALILAAVLAVVLASWDALLLQPLEAKRTALAADLDTMQSSMAATSQAIDAARRTDPTAIALGNIKTAERDLALANSDIGSTSAGLLPPERMIEVLQDMLGQRREIALISLRSEPVANLLPQSSAGPFLHPVELVLTGRYLDILNYLRALEALHWRFYWKTLELDNAHYPLDRVRIELSTLSLDRTWLGL